MATKDTKDTKTKWGEGIYGRMGQDERETLGYRGVRPGVRHARWAVRLARGWTFLAWLMVTVLLALWVVRVLGTLPGLIEDYVAEGAVLGNLAMLPLGWAVAVIVSNRVPDEVLAVQFFSSTACGAAVVLMALVGRS